MNINHPKELKKVRNVKIVQVGIDGKYYSFSGYYSLISVEYKVGQFVKAPKWLAKAGYHDRKTRAKLVR